MNSNSRYYHDDECDSCGKEKNEFKKEKKEVCPTIIKCSPTGAATLPAATAAGTTVTLTSLTLNTSHLCNPCTKLEFTSNIITAAWTGGLSFQVYKQCVNQFTPVPVGPAFTYARAAANTDADTFTFFVCDCDSCFNDCCTYTVVLTVTVVTAATIAINNATLGAIATCQTNGCC